MAGNKNQENNNPENVNKVAQKAIKPLDKDYAHFPPTSVEQVTKPLTKALKETEVPNTSNNIETGTPATADSSPLQNGNGITNKGERIVNESKKIVNKVDESYSDGSGGAFEATEQVNE